MASPHQTDDPSAGDRTHSPTVHGEAEDFPEESADSPADSDSDPQPPKVLRLRIAAWDVVATLAILGALLLLATMTKWPSILFGFMEQVCEGDECGAVPFGIDYYIRPLVWGGIGAAITAATLGPFVSMLKGWYMSFWPALALALIVISAVVGSVLTMICRPYWGG
jgi:hypothetical protein